MRIIRRAAPTSNTPPQAPNDAKPDGVLSEKGGDYGLIGRRTELVPDIDTLFAITWP